MYYHIDLFFHFLFPYNWLILVHYTNWILFCLTVVVRVGNVSEYFSENLKFLSCYFFTNCSVSVRKYPGNRMLGWREFTNGRVLICKVPSLCEIANPVC